jgi:membrane-associated phospholipid phosphatase
MRNSEYWNILYFGVFVCIALVRPLPRYARIKAIALGLVGLAIIGGAELMLHLFFSKHNAVVRDWLPVVLMPIAYWQAGAFFTNPNERLQGRLEAFDRRFIPNFFLYAQRRAPVMEAIFESCYVLCYPLIPAGITALYLGGLAFYSEQYWQVVLPSAYICYGILPFFQTLPPRSVERLPARFNTALRGFNFWMLRHVSHQANTFPSAHVSASMAAALALFEFAPPFGLVFMILAIAIAVASVLGRYHYALDAITGAAVAIAVFALA